MTRQGLCLDATQAPVNILDRLEGLSKVVHRRSWNRHCRRPACPGNDLANCRTE